MGFSKNPFLDPQNPRWRRSTILNIDMTLFFSSEGGPISLKFRRLVQNDMSTAVMLWPEWPHPLLVYTAACHAPWRDPDWTMPDALYRGRAV